MTTMSTLERTETAWPGYLLAGAIGLLAWHEFRGGGYSAQAMTTGDGVTFGEPYSQRRYSGPRGGVYYSRNVMIDGDSYSWEGWARDWADTLRKLRAGQRTLPGLRRIDAAPHWEGAPRGVVRNALEIAKVGTREWWVKDTRGNVVSGPYATSKRAGRAARDLAK